VATEQPIANQLDDLEMENAARLRLFAQRLFARIPQELADELDQQQRQAIAIAAFAFFERRDQPIKVRVIEVEGAKDLIAVETLMPDCPFIVDSLREYFRSREISVRMLLHPLYQIHRATDGSILSFEQGTAAEKSESLVYAQIEFSADRAARQRLESDLVHILTQVRAATDDFSAMTQRALHICEETAALRELVEVRDFLRWLVHGGFVFLGYRRYQVEPFDGQPAIVTDGTAGLGIMRVESHSRFGAPTPLVTLDEGLRKLLFDGPALIIGKTHAESVVHRSAPMDDVTIRRVDNAGQPVGFDRFIGLFTSKAYAEEAEHIPVVRAKLRDLIESENVKPGTHDYKALIAAFNSFPKEELFRAGTEELREQTRLILHAQNDDDVRLSIETDRVRGIVIALVIMPRERFSVEVRHQIQDTLAEGLGGKLIYYYLALGEGFAARLHFSFVASPPSAALISELGERVANIARSWEDLLRERLVERHGATRARELFTQWTSTFDPSYRGVTSPETAMADLEQIEQLGPDDQFRVVVIPAPDKSELRLYDRGEAPTLSELVPMLQNFGISVLSEESHELHLDGDRECQAHIEAFQVRTTDGLPLPQKPGAALISAALVAVRTGHAEDDALNALVLNAGLSWREVALLRAYLAAAFQMKLAPARPAARRPFLLCPQLARLAIAIARARLDPSIQAPADRIAELRRAYLDQLSNIDNIADDRMARTLLAMVEGTTRTNFFAPKPGPCIALKFESARLPGLPDVAPLYEIHVNSPAMEGCHLRSGKIARGGIRYSDRFDDYRTEILGLMKTQTVKNAIIVPTGAKGGFVVKRTATRVPDHAAVVQAYRSLIESMLELTDNVVEGAQLHPAGVKVRDDDGPYLVVAADKGTAAFSDIANQLSEGRAFWLGDAFASGGVHGYDHKKLGITARGAWESAKRHLRELGRDLIHGAPITVVGIGDMSGDVFGNGLLQSDNLKLIAAFDHRHIFIDPDPDPARSHAERRRLFENPNSQWSDYDPALISPGGGVFRRGQKVIPLSPEIRTALDLAETEIDSDRLIQAILRAKVDMLYNGGIGTYVRAGDETDADADDHANDACRITAPELRCKIVVEGGNLGFTQKARIAYALEGGRINADAIDNSAGVDMSDHEVNLKILLQPIVARGELTETRRNRLLAEAAEEVAANVLRDNRDQALLLSLEQARSRLDVIAFRDHLTAVEQRGVVKLPESPLPSRDELRERRSSYPGLTRPELAVLTALSKIDLSHTLQQAKVIDDPFLIDRFLRPYFPASIANAFADHVPRHILRRELIATRLVNELIDLMGSTFVFKMVRDLGIVEETAVKGWLVASSILDLRTRAEDLHRSAAEFAADVEIGAFLGLERPARDASIWALNHGDEALGIGETVTRFKPHFDQLLENFETLLAGGERARFEQVYRDLRAAVHQEQLAHQLARLNFAGHLLNIIDLSLMRDADPLAVAKAYFAMSERFEFALIEGALDSINTEDRWERMAARDLRAELAWARNQLCLASFDHRVGGLRTGTLLQRRVAEAQRMMGDLRALPSVGLPPLQVAVRALSRLAGAIMNENAQ
jgi:glutamate dehydrogenase